MTLHKSTMTIPDKKAKQIFKLLNQRENDWNKQQNILRDKKLLKNCRKQTTNQYKQTSYCRPAGLGVDW